MLTFLLFHLSFSTGNISIQPSSFPISSFHLNASYLPLTQILLPSLTRRPHATAIRNSSARSHNEVFSTITTAGQKTPMYSPAWLSCLRASINSYFLSSNFFLTFISMFSLKPLYTLFSFTIAPVLLLMNIEGEVCS